MLPYVRVICGRREPSNFRQQSPEGILVDSQRPNLRFQRRPRHPQLDCSPAGPDTRPGVSFWAKSTLTKNAPSVQVACPPSSGCEMAPGLSTIRKLSRDVRALLDARFDGKVAAARVFWARSIKSFERSRPWLRRTRALWAFN